MKQTRQECDDLSFVGALNIDYSHLLSQTRWKSGFLHVQTAGYITQRQMQDNNVKIFHTILCTPVTWGLYDSRVSACAEPNK